MINIIYLCVLFINNSRCQRNELSNDLQCKFFFNKEIKRITIEKITKIDTTLKLGDLTMKTHSPANLGFTNGYFMDYLPKPFLYSFSYQDILNMNEVDKVVLNFLGENEIILFNLVLDMSKPYPLKNLMFKKGTYSKHLELEMEKSLIDGIIILCDQKDDFSEFAISAKYFMISINAADIVNSLNAFYDENLQMISCLLLNMSKFNSNFCSSFFEKKAKSMEREIKLFFSYYINNLNAPLDKNYEPTKRHYINTFFSLLDDLRRKLYDISVSYETSRKDEISRYISTFKFLIDHIEKINKEHSRIDIKFDELDKLQLDKTALFDTYKRKDETQPIGCDEKFENFKRIFRDPILSFTEISLNYYSRLLRDIKDKSNNGFNSNEIGSYSHVVYSKIYVFEHIRTIFTEDKKDEIIHFLKSKLIDVLSPFSVKKTLDKINKKNEETKKIEESLVKDNINLYIPIVLQVKVPSFRINDDDEAPSIKN